GQWVTPSSPRCRFEVSAGALATQGGLASAGTLVFTALRDDGPRSVLGIIGVGFVGWRGMVGSVLMQRMQQENDFAHIEPTFFTTSNVGGKGPAIGKVTSPLKHASDLAALQ